MLDADATAIRSVARFALGQRHSYKGLYVCTFRDHVWCSILDPRSELCMAAPAWGSIPRLRIMRLLKQTDSSGCSALAKRSASGEQRNPVMLITRRSPPAQIAWGSTKSAKTEQGFC